MAALKCYTASQAEYIRAYNAKAIEANLSKIDACQHTEECAETITTTIHSKKTTTPHTVGATINTGICCLQQEMEKRLQSLEHCLANKKSKAVSLEQHLQHQ